MAIHCYLSIQGKTQGLISKECSTLASMGNKFQSNHTDEIMVLSCNHNMVLNGNIDTPTHGPLIITKYIDKSSPLLAKALVNKEEILKCMLSIYRTANHGGLEKFYSIVLTDSIIADLTLDIPHAVLQHTAEPQEHVSIRYKSIKWEHHLTNTRSANDWSPGHEK